MSELKPKNGCNPKTTEKTHFSIYKLLRFNVYIAVLPVFNPLGILLLNKTSDD